MKDRATPATAIFIVIIVGTLLAGGCAPTTISAPKTTQKGGETNDPGLIGQQIIPEAKQGGLKIDEQKYGGLIKIHCEDYLALKGKFLEREAENQCYWEIAVATQDETLCELMIDSELSTSQEAKNTCYFFVAGKKKDEKICGMIKTNLEDKQREELELCYATVWSSLKRADLCEKLEVPIAKEKCLRDAEFCKEAKC